MRILVLTEYSYPCDHSYLNDVCATIMPRRGHAVYLAMWGPERGVRRWGGAVVVMLGKPFRSRWLGAVANYLNMFRMLCAGRRIVGRCKIDVVQSRADWTVAMVATLLARWHGLRFVYQANYPTEAERMLAGRNGLAGLVRRLDIAFHMKTFPVVYRSASAILPISESYARYFRARGVPPAKLHPFPMGVSGEVLAAAPSAADGLSRRAVHGFDAATTVVGYLGTLHGQRDPAFLDELFAAILQADESFRILVIGAEDRGVGLGGSRYAESMWGGRLRVTGWLPRTEALRQLHGLDVGLSVIPPTKIYRISSPTKVVEMMAARVPVIVNREIADQACLVRRSGGGCTCRYERAAVVSAVLQLRNRPEDRKAMGERGYEYVRKHRCYEIMFQRVEDLYGQ